MDEAADGAGQGACFRCLDMLIGSSLLMWCRGLRGVWSLGGERGGVG